MSSWRSSRSIEPDIFVSGDSRCAVSDVNYFGRLRVRHVHLFDPDTPWRPDSLPFQRTSDHHLVYCTGAIDERCYLQMALLSPAAHQQALQFDIMAKLGVMAERFRLSY